MPPRSSESSNFLVLHHKLSGMFGERQEFKSQVNSEHFIVRILINS